MPALDQLPPDAQRLAKFSLVGVSNTLVSFASYAVLIALDVEYALAGAIAWTLGVLNGYTWNRIWTFDRASHRHALLIRYMAVGLLGLGLNTALLVLLIGAIGLGELIAEGIALPLVVLTSFLLNRYWVFAASVQRLST